MAALSSRLTPPRWAPQSISWLNGMNRHDAFHGVCTDGSAHSVGLRTVDLADEATAALSIYAVCAWFLFTQVNFLFQYRQGIHLHFLDVCRSPLQFLGKLHKSPTAQSHRNCQSCYYPMARRNRGGVPNPYFIIIIIIAILFVQKPKM